MSRGIIWTEDHKYKPVKTLKQALWHLKVMRAGIRSCLNNPSVQAQQDDEDRMVEEVQEQALTVVIDHLKNSNMNEWIPVSKKLPAVGTFVYATCQCEGRENWVIDTCYVPIPKNYNVRGYSDWGNIPILNSGKAKVIAWMEQDIPEPYHEKTEENV